MATILVDKQKSFQAANTALELSQQLKNDSLIAYSYETLKHNYLHDSNFDKAIYYLDSAIYYYQILDNQRNFLSDYYSQII